MASRSTLNGCRKLALCRAILLHLRSFSKAHQIQWFSQEPPALCSLRWAHACRHTPSQFMAPLVPVEQGPFRPVVGFWAVCGESWQTPGGALPTKGAAGMCTPWPKRPGVTPMLPATSRLHRSLWECGKDVSLFVSAGPFSPRVWLGAWMDRWVRRQRK